MSILGVIPFAFRATHAGVAGHFDACIFACMLRLVANFRVLLRTVISQYRLPLNGTHGMAHWGRVLENGRRLSSLTGAALEIVELFSIFHDSQRRRESGDHGHGPRAAAFISSIRDTIDLPNDALSLLVEACECHTRGAAIGANITVLTCLDADRLDIPRVGIAIRPDLLYTAAAKDPDVLGWASTRAKRRVIPWIVRNEWNKMDFLA